MPHYDLLLLLCCKLSADPGIVCSVNSTLWNTYHCRESAAFLHAIWLYAGFLSRLQCVLFQVTLQMVSTFSALVPIVDCSGASQVRSDLTEVGHAPSSNCFRLRAVLFCCKWLCYMHCTREALYIIFLF